MTETIFILTVLYIAYVIYLIRTSCDEKKQADPAGSTPKAAVAKTVSKKAKSAVVVEKPKPAAKKAKPAAKKAKPAAKKAKSVTAITEMPVGSIRNPETGDLVKLGNSYQMTRKWIKEALVAEGLLKKVYKTTELDDDTKVKAYAALDQLRAMAKYK